MQVDLQKSSNLCTRGLIIEDFGLLKVVIVKESTEW